MFIFEKFAVMKNHYLFVLIPILLSILPKFSYAQAPSLGSAEDFALFTTVGSFTLTGSNIIFGDVGTNNGAYTIPGSLSLTGTSHIQDSKSGMAATDLASAYTYLSTLTCDSTISSTLGNNRVLLPGVVYCINSAATLNGNLILDGKNTSGAIFNINIDGALSTNTSSTITLINGASFCNVYWQVNGAVDFGANSIFNGTVIANGALSLLNQAQLFGRALSIAGSISTSDNEAIGCDASFNPLSIKLTTFTAKTIDNHVILNWSTANEINNNYFTIQHSVDAITFKDLGQIKGAGNSNSKINYLFIDQHPFKGSSYYRLVQTNFDGQSTYSDILNLKRKDIVEFRIYPNPLGSTTTIILKEDTYDKTSNFEFKLFNILGEEVMKTTLSEQTTSLNTQNLISGIYFYKVIIDNEMIQSGKLIAN